MPVLQITLLGKPAFSIDEQPVFQESHTKAQALLCYLATTGRTHYRNELASLFWPDMPDVQALKNLRNILPVLRARMGAYMLITRQTVAFNRSMLYWFDVEAFESLLRSAPAQASTAALWEAVDLYRDDFLNGFYVRNALLFEEWMLLKRERLRDMLIGALQTLASRHLHEQDYHAALNASRRLLTVAPWHEHGHQQQMQALLGLDQRSAALAQYHICARILATEFDVAPSHETTSLYERIKATSATFSVDMRSVDGAAPDSPPPLRATCLPTAVSSDGKLFAVLDTRNTIRLENLTTGRIMHWLSGHTAAVTALSFSPDGHSIASGSADQTVRLWETASGSPYSILQAHRHPVIHVAFVPDGSRLVSIDTKRVVMFWDLMARHSHNIHVRAMSVNE
jgi:DNA-binding SARP family transcriptional activator